MPWVLTWFCFELNTIRLSQFANTNVFHSRLPVKRTVLAELRQHKEAFQIRCAEVCVAIRATRHLPTLSRETFRIKSWKTHRRKTQNWDFDQRLRQTWDFKTQTLRTTLQDPLSRLMIGKPKSERFTLLLKTQSRDLDLRHLRLKDARLSIETLTRDLDLRL